MNTREFNLVTVHKNLLEMLEKYRQYEVPQEVKARTPKEIVELLSENNTDADSVIIVTTANLRPDATDGVERPKSLVVFLGTCKKIGVGLLRMYMKTMSEMEPRIDHAILLTAYGVTPISANEYYDTSFTFETMMMSDLIVPVVDHEMYDANVAMSTEQKKALLLQYGSFDKFPTLSVNDSACQFHGFLPGTVVKIFRTWGIPEITYKVVRKI